MLLNLPLSLRNPLLLIRYVICLSLRFLHELGRHNYVTATSYLELIASFRQLLTKKRQAVMEAKQRYVTGLDKLAFAESQVSLMNCSEQWYITGNVKDNSKSYNWLRKYYVPGTVLCASHGVLQLFLITPWGRHFMFTHLSKVSFREIH